MLKINNLSFSVDSEGQKKEIIKNINLEIPKGKLFVITGPNGGGKSTLAKLITGIENPTGGQIIFNGTDITEKRCPFIWASFLSARGAAARVASLDHRKLTRHRCTLIPHQWSRYSS